MFLTKENFATPICENDILEKKNYLRPIDDTPVPHPKGQQCTVWKNEKFNSTRKIFRENSLECNSVLIRLIPRDFCEKTVRANFRKISILCKLQVLMVKDDFVLPISRTFSFHRKLFRFFFFRSRSKKNTYSFLNTLTHHRTFHEIFLFSCPITYVGGKLFPEYVLLFHCNEVNF